MPTDGRPTLRCLSEDLPNDWDSAADYSDAAAGASAKKALYALDHPIIQKARTDFRVTDSKRVAGRESISGLSDPPWWKVKTGARWRGAVYVDSEGQAWLCAAGYRREGEGTDFYKHFMAAIGSDGPARFLPTDDDYARLEREEIATVVAVWERNLVNKVRESFQTLIAPGGQLTFDVERPGSDELLCRVELTVEVELVDDTALTDIVVAFNDDSHVYSALAYWAHDVMLIALDASLVRWQSLPYQGTMAHSQTLDGEQLRQLLDAWTKPSQPGVPDDIEECHFAHRHGLTESTILGTAVKSVCGVWFVPTQDHDSLPVCNVCSSIHRLLPE